MERNTNRKRWHADKKLLLNDISNSDESENDKSDENSVYNRNMRENFANGVLCMFELLQNMIPVPGKDDYLGKRFRRPSATLDMRQKLTEEPTKILKGNKKSKYSRHRPNINTDIENTSSDDSESQIWIPDKYSSKRKAKKSVSHSTDEKSGVVINRSSTKTNKTNTPRTAIEPNFTANQSRKSKSTHLYKDANQHELLRREPKRSKATYYKTKKDDANNCPRTNEAQSLRSKTYKKKAKEILDILVQPSTKHTKVQSIQILKKNKHLLSVFLDEKQKLAEKRIPILKPRKNLRIHATSKRHSDCIQTTTMEVEPEITKRKSINPNDKLLKNENNHVSCSTKTNRKESMCNERDEIKQLLSRILKYKDVVSNSKMQVCSEIRKDPSTFMNRMQPGINRSFSADSIGRNIHQYENTSEEHTDKMAEREINNMPHIFHSSIEEPIRYSDLSYVDLLANIQSEVLTQTEETHLPLATGNDITVNNSELLDLKQSNHINGNYLSGNFQTSVIESTAQDLLHPIHQQQFQYRAYDTENRENHTIIIPPCLTDSKNTNTSFHDMLTAQDRTAGSYVTLTNLL